MHGGIDVLDLSHDQRIVAAHFQREHDLRTAAELPMQQRAGIRAAREEQAIDLPMIRQRNAGVLLALHQVQHAGRQAGLRPQIHRHRRHSRREFRWFEHDRIPRDQRRDNVPVRQMSREVVRAEHGHDAMRTMPKYCYAVSHFLALLAGTFVIRLDGDIDFSGHRRDFGPRFPQRLTGLETNGVSQRFLVPGQQRRETPSDRYAFVQRQRGPRSESASR
jgi:hypothetical protein